MKRIILAIIVLSLVAIACGSSVPKTPEEYAKEYDGSVDVYRAILTSNDCAYLQVQFDTAFNNSETSEPGTIHHKRAVGFMTASNQRMEEIGCYESSNVSPSTLLTTATEIVVTISQNTSTPFILPTLTQAATSLPEMISIPTNTIVFILPTNPQSDGQAACDCSGDSLNCSDFTSQAGAQACMDFCVSIGRGDIHNLDGDANGLACESL